MAQKGSLLQFYHGKKEKEECGAEDSSRQRDHIWRIALVAAMMNPKTVDLEASNSHIQIWVFMAQAWKFFFVS